MGFLDGIRDTIERKREDNRAKDIERINKEAEREEKRASYQASVKAGYDRIAKARENELEAMRARDRADKASHEIFERKVAPIKRVLGGVGGALKAAGPSERQFKKAHDETFDFGFGAPSRSKRKRRDPLDFL